MLDISLLSSLIQILDRDEALNKHFDMGDWDYKASKLENISVAERSYIMALIFKKKRAKLNLKITQLGFKQKNI